MTEEMRETLNRVEVRTGEHRTIKSYVLRSNTLDEKQEETVQKYYEKYGVRFVDEMTEPNSLIADPEKPVVIEIGFGMGTSTIQVARERNEYNYLGLEVYLQGYVKLLKMIGEEGLDNIRIMSFNAVDVLERMIPDGSIQGFHIFFPDPWPKKKHHKRRIIQSDFVSLLARKLRKGGYIYLVTDWEEYAEWMMEIILKEPLLKNRFDGFAKPSDWRPMTKFERKGLDKDYEINELMFERI